MRAQIYDDPSGDGGGGGGSVSTSTSTTTSTSTSGAVGSNLPAAKSVAFGGAVVGGIRAAVAVASVPVQATPQLRVMPGDRVFVKPLPQNTKPVQIAQYSLAAVHGPFDYVSPGDTEREYPVPNTGDIWIAQVGADFVLGEGISVTIRRAQ